MGKKQKEALKFVSFKEFEEIEAFLKEKVEYAEFNHSSVPDNRFLAIITRDNDVPTMLVPKYPKLKALFDVR